MLNETYKNLTFNQWFEQKIHLLSQLFIHAQEYSVFDFGADELVNKLRMMDVLHLFSGNLIVVIGMMLTLIFFIKNSFQLPSSLDDFSNDKTIINLVFFSSFFTIILYFLIFMAPFELPHLPYNMLFVLILVSFGYIYKSHFSIYKYLLVPFVLLYGSAVWIIAPLFNCLRIDYISLLTMLIFSSLIYLYILNPKWINDRLKTF